MLNRTSNNGTKGETYFREVASQVPRTSPVLQLLNLLMHPFTHVRILSHEETLNEPTNDRLHELAGMQQEHEQVSSQEILIITIINQRSIIVNLRFSVDILLMIYSVTIC